MSLTPEAASRVVGFVFPEKLVSYNRRDAILYALGVGTTDLRYCCEEDEDFAPLPTLPLVLGLKGTSSDVVPFGLESFTVPPGLEDIPPTSIIHGDQSIEVFGPLPAEGKDLANRSKVVALEDKIKGALLRVETELVSKQDGKVLARHGSGIFFKGCGNFGGARGQTHKSTPLPSRPPDRTISMETLPCQALLYRLSGDYNLLHVDPSLASMAGFDRPIMHGLCTFGFAARAVIAACCPDAPAKFRSLRGRFAAAAYPGETLHVDIWEEGGGSVRCRVVAADPKAGRTKGRVVLTDGAATVEGGKLVALNSRL